MNVRNEFDFSSKTASATAELSTAIDELSNAPLDTAMEAFESPEVADTLALDLAQSWNTTYYEDKFRDMSQTDVSALSSPPGIYWPRHTSILKAINHTHRELYVTCNESNLSNLLCVSI